MPIDMDILEKVCSGKRTLDSRPFEKIEFNPFGPVAKMKAVTIQLISFIKKYDQTFNRICPLKFKYQTIIYWYNKLLYKNEVAT